MISPIFTTIVISFLSIMIYMKVTTARFNTGDDKRLEEERQANSVRRKSLDELEYINIPFPDPINPDIFHTRCEFPFRNAPRLAL